MGCARPSSDAGVLVPTVKGEQAYINLDNGASTPTFAPIWEAAWRGSRATVPAAMKSPTRSSRSVPMCLHSPRGDYDVIFTGNTTESINLVADSLGHGRGDGTETVVLNTSLWNTIRTNCRGAWRRA